jgi:hypothetical protein
VTAVLLVAVLLTGVGAGWYFWGVETVVVCTPPDVKVFLDGAELTPESPGRFVVPHLARGRHILKVQRAGYSEVTQIIDPPLSTTNEWVNIRLAPVPGKKGF